jgi:C-terminal processing protease CtpA/Prc
MSRFTVIFNFPAEEIYLRKNSNFKHKFYYNLSGITLKAKGAQLATFEVTEVRKMSPGATAGILPGDLILALNGISVAELDLNIINGFLNSKPGRRIRLEIDRNGTRIRKDIELKDQI